MLQVAGLAPRLLNDASENVVNFIHSRFDPKTGSYLGRDNHPDLYYVIFALSCLRALKAEIPQDEVFNYLENHSDQEQISKMDCVTVSSLARAYTLLPDKQMRDDLAELIFQRLQAFQSQDGAFHNHQENAKSGTPYGSFLVLGAYQDLDHELPDSEPIIKNIKSLEREPGIFANEAHITQGIITVSAAALAVLRVLQSPIDEQSAIDSILQYAYKNGGFFASKMTPMPDLLSTATALHALSGLNYDFNHIREAQLDFVDTLWSSRGAFHGNWADEILDCEYTFYGLLALGHLSL